MTAEERAVVQAMRAAEYAKIHAVKERIAGLRRGMVAVAIGGVVTSTVVFWLSFFVFITQFRPSFVGDAIQLGFITWLPFIALIGYLSYRVNRYIERLSQGKFEPRRVIE